VGASLRGLNCRCFNLRLDGCVARGENPQKSRSDGKTLVHLIGIASTPVGFGHKIKSHTEGGV
jgi:hypothetical protein